MQFAMTEEQQMIVDTTRAFVEKEIYPHELAVERSGHLPMDQAPALVRLKRVAFGLLIFCGLTFLIQMTLLSHGAYERWLVALINWLGSGWI